MATSLNWMLFFSTNLFFNQKWWICEQFFQLEISNVRTQPWIWTTLAFRSIFLSAFLTLSWTNPGLTLLSPIGLWYIYPASRRRRVDIKRIVFPPMVGWWKDSQSFQIVNLVKISITFLWEKIFFWFPWVALTWFHHRNIFPYIWTKAYRHPSWLLK